jgi:hypothetical protein
MMTEDQHQVKLESYRNAYDQLLVVLSECPSSAIDFRPDPGEWSIHEIVVHLADSEMNNAVRCRQTISDPGKFIMPYDEGRWATAMHYSDQDMDDALGIFRLLRSTTYKLLKAQPVSVWSHLCQHPVRGVLSLDDLLTLFEQHGRLHIDQISRNLDSYLKSSLNGDQH